MVTGGTELVAQPREIGKGKSYIRSLRRSGIVPAILYGRGYDARPLQLVAKDLDRALSGSDRTVVARLTISGEGTPHNVIVKEVQHHPLHGTLVHVDLLEISLTERIRVSVGILVVGEEEVAGRGGIVQQVAREVEVECLPGAIPDRFAADVSELNVGEVFKVADLEVPEGVSILSDPSDPIVSVSAPRAAVEEEPEEMEGADDETADKPGEAEA